LLDAGVVFGGGVVHEAARRGDLVLEIAELVLKPQEILVRLQLRIVLGDRVQTREAAAQLALRGAE